MLQLIPFKAPGHNEIYVAFCDNGWIKYKVYCVNGFWVVEDSKGDIYDQNPDLGDLLEDWKKEFSL